MDAAVGELQAGPKVQAPEVHLVARWPPDTVLSNVPTYLSRLTVAANIHVCNMNAIQAWLRITIFQQKKGKHSKTAKKQHGVVSLKHKKEKVKNIEQHGNQFTRIGDWRNGFITRPRGKVPVLSENRYEMRPSSSGRFELLTTTPGTLEAADGLHATVKKPSNNRLHVLKKYLLA